MLSFPVLSQDEHQPESDSLSTIQVGFSGSTNSDIDYDALVKELYGEEEVKAEVDLIDTKQDKQKQVRRTSVGPAPGMFKNSFLHGSHLAFSASSPFAVAEPLQSWYSYIDASVTLKLPYEIYVESIPLYILFEVSSFSFENSYPEGGVFSGIAYIMQAATIGDHSGAALGFGLWDKSLGSMLELNYRFRPTTNTFLRLGARGVLITDVEPLGAPWWMELKLSTGFEF